MNTDCGCSVVFESETKKISYCPIHAAAFIMRDALRAVMEVKMAWDMYVPYDEAMRQVLDGLSKCSSNLAVHEKDGGLYRVTSKLHEDMPKG